MASKCEMGKPIFIFRQKPGWAMEALQEKLLETIGWHQETGIFMARARHLEALATAGQRLIQAYAAAWPS